jgi:putative transposase
VHLVDERTGAVLDRLYPLDRVRNSDGQRRALEPLGAPAAYAGPPAPAVPPLMTKLLSDYAALGLPPAYLPKDEKGTKHE